MISQEYLKSILSYCPDTGIFTWVKTHPCSNKKPGDRAGHIHTNTGYVSITINRRFNAAHRLAFLFMTGSYPNNEIDHINHIRHDNRWCNIRDVTNFVNHQNKSFRKDNKSGTSGVAFDKLSQRWQVRVCINKVRHYFGSYTDKEEAVAVRHKAVSSLGFSNRHGLD